jgi:pyruvate/2-oxoglutarate dehydrogenase complex dihydrolipoamide dehydrogenase (E3) component
MVNESPRGTHDMSDMHGMEPFDRHNQVLVNNVHPPDWVNRSPADRYHLVVVGGGTAGLVLAAGAAGLGARVALVERHLLGGDCLNVGCVPSKGVISAARAWRAAREVATDFGGPEVSGTGDFAKAMERMREIRAGISNNDSAARFRDLGIDVFLGDGRFTSSSALAVGGSTLNFRRAVIATGGRAEAPPIPGLDAVHYMTNETIFALTELPESLAVIGAGPIGCEMAQSFAQFGTRVTLLDMADHVLPREDPDAAAVVQAQMTVDGVELELGVAIQSVDMRGNRTRVVFESEGQTREVTTSGLLVAVGRRPNVEGLGLDEAGVSFNRRGVEVDDHLRTSNRRVFACGDVASEYQFTHTADAQARIVIQNALFYGRARNSRLVIPWCTYTSPEIAHVGMYEAEAREAGRKVQTIRVPFSEVDRAVLDGVPEGFLRVHHESGRILGATLVGSHAGDIIGEMAVAITHGIGLGQLSATIHPYPTHGEVMRKVGDLYRRTSLTSSVKKAFAAWFRLLR